MAQSDTRARKHVRVVRQMLRLTQSELGTKVRVSSSKLSLYETGLVDLTPKELGRVNRFLNKHLYKTIDAGKKLSDQGQEPAGISFRDLIKKPARIPLSAFTAETSAWQLKSTLDEKTRRRFERQRSGLSQRELAQKSKIPRNKLIEFENNRAELTPDEQSRWIQALGDAMGDKKVADPYWHMERLQKALDEARKLNDLKDQVIEARKLECHNSDEIINNLREIIKIQELRIAELEEWQNAEESAALAHARAEELRLKVLEDQKFPANDLETMAAKKETAPKDGDD